MNTLNDLRALLEGIGMFAGDVDETIVEAQAMVETGIEALREKLQGADPTDTRPSEFCDCGRTDYEHFVKYFGSPDAEDATRALVEDAVVREGLTRTLLSVIGMDDDNFEVD